MIYIFNFDRAEIYINTSRKTLAQIQAETGADVLINGGLYDMARFIPYCHLKANGYVYAEDKYSYFGFGWNRADKKFTMTSEYKALDNYICCVALLKGGKAQKLIYGASLGGKRGRTAIGTLADGRTAIYCSKDGAAEDMTPEELQKYLLGQGWVDALMLDSGGSSQCITPEGSVGSSRIVHNVLCFRLDGQAGKDDDGGFKIALGAGHGINSAGKRCMKSLDPNETREWWLNDRICDYIADELMEYEGYQLLRTDDWDDGKDNIALSARAKAANDWGADIYLSIHHNAGANGTAAGGIVAFSHPNDSSAAHAWRDELYAALIEHTGLKGNRWSGTLSYNYQILRETEMPAVLLELGFMDSKTDVPIILTDEYARKCAKAIAGVIVRRGGLKRRETAEEEKRYLVKVAFREKSQAEKLCRELSQKGYTAEIMENQK